MAVALNTDTGSIVAQAGQEVDVALLLDITAGNNPTYLVVSLLDREEYTASGNGSTGTLSGNGHTLGFSNIGGDSDTVGIVFTYNALTGQYANATYGNLANLLYTALTKTNDDTSISFFTTNDSALANEYANNPYVLEQDAPTVKTYLGSISVVTQPAFTGPTRTQATPHSIEAAAISFVGEAWNMNGCWVLASNVSAEAGASLPITSASLGIPGVPSGEWIVAYDGPAGQTGNWESMITAGKMVVFETSATSGHITTVVSGSGSSAMLVDNITYLNQNGQIVNSANDGSANDIIISAPHLASQEWAMAVPGSVVVYELDCPIITVTTAVSTDAAGKTVALAPLFSASNPLASQAITQYQFYNVGTGDAVSDSFMVGSTDEVGHSAANAITVSSSALSTVDLLAGGSFGTDTIEMRAFNGSCRDDWVSMTVDISGDVNARSPPTVTSVADVTEALYLGYFDRAADPAGDAYWLNQLSVGNISETSMAASFSVQPEATALYLFLAGPSTVSQAQITSFIESGYADLFNRVADSGGLTYWDNYLTTNLGNPQAVGALILDVIFGAQGTDQTTIATKVTVADYFTQEVAVAGIGFTAAASTLANGAIASVTSASSTVLTAESTISSWVTTTAQSTGAEIALVGTSHTSLLSTAHHI
jgi:hypothetical protein